MKNADQIRQLLKSILLIYGGNNHQLGEWTKEALALLPCPTCNDSGRIPTFDQASGLADADLCPDCQKKPKQQEKSSPSTMWEHLH